MTVCSAIDAAASKYSPTFATDRVAKLLAVRAHIMVESSSSIKGMKRPSHCLPDSSRVYPRLFPQIDHRAATVRMYFSTDLSSLFRYDRFQSRAKEGGILRVSQEEQRRFHIFLYLTIRGRKSNTSFHIALFPTIRGNVMERGYRF